eukprot:jgi/Psemu1/48226/gm1.48226_g
MDMSRRGKSSRTSDTRSSKRRSGKLADFVSITVDKYSFGTEEDDDAVQKRLGCRRTLKDMLLPEEQQKIDQIDDNPIELDGPLELHDGPLQREQIPRQKPRSLWKAEPNRRLVFTSPRLISSDEDLFPSDHSLYKESNQRWQQISNQAGCHRQDGTVMNIGRKPASSKAFRIGMIECAALRVRSLNLWLDHDKDTLPDWLYMISEVFVNLEHLTLTEDIFPGEDDMAVSARMRRLYVLSILPDLKSIDDMIVTTKERKMANPSGYIEESQDKTHEARSPDNKSIDRESDQQDYSRVVTSVPVSINTDSVGSSKSNAIEVEIVDSEFGEMKIMGTQTTSSSSPTSNSESTITPSDSDEHVEDDYENGGGNLNKTVQTDSNERGTNGPSNEKIGVDEARSNVTEGTMRTLNDDWGNTIELVSVASHDFEWSAACGILTFGKDRACAPIIRLPFSSRDKKTKDSVSDTTTLACQKAVKNLRKKEKEKEKEKEKKKEKKKEKGNSRLIACPPVYRQSEAIVPTPQVGCCPMLESDTYSQAKFLFPSGGKGSPFTNGGASNERISDLRVSANKQLPPSRSLSSPFPMQFRDRQKPSCDPVITQLVVNTSDLMDSDCEKTESSCDSKESNEMDTITSPLSVDLSPISSPKDINNKLKKANKGELPPKCPSGGTRRQAPTCNVLKQRKQKVDRRRKVNEASKESARSISVMDLDDEEEFCDENFENSGEVKANLKVNWNFEARIEKLECTDEMNRFNYAIKMITSVQSSRDCISAVERIGRNFA